MPIEFRCHQCGKLLRVGDETAGKQAKCPSCGAVQPIPAAAPSPELPSPPPGASAGNPFGATPNAGFGAPPPSYQTENPYASPPSSLLPPAGPFYESIGGPRSGPPWERDGASISSYFATFKETFTSPNFMFSDMRRVGGLGAPLFYGMAGGVAWGVIGLAFQLGVQSLMMGMVGGLAGPGGPGAPPAFAPGIFLGVGLFAGVIILPIATIISMFFFAGIFHLMLMMLSAARQPFETSFRVVAYSHGTSSVLAAVPFCGQYAQGIAQLIFVGIGLCRAHEISGGKAALAVLLPVIVCCGGLIALYAVVIGAIIAGAR